MIKIHRPLSGLLLATTALFAPQLVSAQEAEVSEVVILGEYIPEVMRETSEVAAYVSEEDLVRQGDDTAAGTLTRVTGISVVSGRYVYVRGLGERYSAALLNGSPLPSPEPLLRVVPLDLFPTNILQNVQVQKTYSPNYPGEFGGGIIDLTTVEIPTQPYLTIGGSMGFNTETTLENGLTYYGSDTDFLGWDDGTRKMPPLLRDAVATGRRVDQSNFSDAELTRIGRTFVNAPINLLQEQDDTPFNGSFDISAGNSLVYDWGNIGIVGVFGYDNSWTTRIATQQEGVASGAGLSVQEDFQSYSTRNDITINALGGVALELDRHEFKWTNFYVRNVTKEAQSNTGDSARASNFVRDDLTAWYQRELISTQLTGEHDFDPLTIRWRGSFARTERDAPYERSIRYIRLPNGSFIHSPQRDANFIRFSEVEDETAGFGLDLIYETDFGPVTNVKLQGGYAWYDNDRYSDQRAFRFFTTTTPSLAFQSQRIDFLYSDFNIRPDGLILREVTGSEGAAAYRAHLQTHAVYAMAEGDVLPLVRVSAGARYETAKQKVSALDLFSNASLPGQRLENEYLLPAATVTWNFAEDMQVRFGLSKTIARPQFREQAPQLYLDPETDRTFIGNPYLTDSELINVDARYEYYFGPNQFVTLGVFYKDIDKPIESVVNETGSGLQQTYLNAPRATIYGIEGEVRKYFEPDFGMSWIDSQRWFFNVNYTYSKAEVVVESGDVVFPLTGAGMSQPASNFVIDGSRLQGQSEHLANLQFGFENDDTRTQATLLATYASERTTARGPAGTPDFVQEPGVMLDFTFRQGFDVWNQDVTFGIEARNLLGTEFDEFQTQGGDTIKLNNYELGTSISFSLSARF